jgi:hypothetical protein
LQIGRDVGAILRRPAVPTTALSPGAAAEQKSSRPDGTWYSHVLSRAKVLNSARSGSARMSFSVGPMGPGMEPDRRRSSTRAIAHRTAAESKLSPNSRCSAPYARSTSAQYTPNVYRSPGCCTSGIARSAKGRNPCIRAVPAVGPEKASNSMRNLMPFCSALGWKFRHPTPQRVAA